MNNEKQKDLNRKLMSTRITCLSKDGILFFNCTKDIIDKVVENDNRYKAYLGIGEWGNDEYDE